MHLFFKLLLMPVKLLSIPFRMVMGLLVGLPLVVLIARLISLPFRALDFFLFLPHPFERCRQCGCSCW